MPSSLPHPRARPGPFPPVALDPSAAPSPAPAAARVAVIMGSDSDLPTLQPGVALLEHFGVVPEVRVLSAHRTPLEMVAFAQGRRSGA